MNKKDESLSSRWRAGDGTACIAGAATLFGILHLDLVYSPMALRMRLFLGWLAERTRSLRLPEFVHVNT